MNSRGYCRASPNSRRVLLELRSRARDTPLQSALWFFIADFFLSESNPADTLNRDGDEEDVSRRWRVASVGGFLYGMMAADEPPGCGGEDDDGVTVGSPSCPAEVPEELHPVAKLERYAYSDIVINRQIVARNIVETLQSVADSQEDINSVVSVMGVLANDCEPSVRAELVEQLPYIASFCANEGGLLAGIVRSNIVPTIVQYLTDVTNQVRKRTQVSLLFILERALIDREQLEEQICRLVVHLTESDNVDDYRTEAVTLMTKMAPYMGKDMTVDLFLPPFVNLCQDSSFHVRKVCAANFGDFCTIVGQECTEDNLLSVFHYLCEDAVWGVRKACAEVFMPVSCVCSLVTRRTNLAPLFLNLLNDQSRWVRIAAFQALGPFISTFADPSRTGLYCSEDGVVSVRSERANACGSCAQVLTMKGSAQGDEGNTASVSGNFAVPSLEMREKVKEKLEGEADNKQKNASDADSGNIKPIYNDKAEKPCGDGCQPVPSSCLQPTAELSRPQGSQGEETLEAPKEVEANGISTALVEVPAGAREHAEEPMAKAGEEERSLLGPHVDDNDNELPPPQPPSSAPPTESECGPVSVHGDRQHLVVHVDSSAAGGLSAGVPTGDSDFNAFQFWRVPIPEVEVDIEFLGDKATAVHVRAKSHDQDNRSFSSDVTVQMSSSTEALAQSHDTEKSQHQSTFEKSGKESMLRIRTASSSSVTPPDQDCNVVMSSSFTEAAVVFSEGGEVATVKNIRVNEFSDPERGTTVATIPLLSTSSSTLNSMSDSWSAHDQDIVPIDLLERYQTMTDPELAQNLDSEICRHCAFSLPAVALTLGRHFWPCLRATYDALASDMQWKVRRIVASCLHELATILGARIAAQDLVPTFEGFVRDVDEVRVGVLQHLGPFLRSLFPADRRRSLPLLAEFHKTDNHRNWRFRLTLAEQLMNIVELYSPTDVHNHLVPIALELLGDKVSEVRQMTVKAVAVLVRHLSHSPNPNYCKQFLQELLTKVQDPKWSQRQLYCELCREMLSRCSMSPALFSEAVLPQLLQLHRDGIANVRMAVARCLTWALLPNAYFMSDDNPYKEQIEAALSNLREDVDRDVRYCSRLPNEIPPV
ncbi:serine/threonine-protein phosphatase 4 regulatory subunit 1-like isoform X2 [Ornithodoros turicata]|uniref:serine/threonine-protein phosphatase 4 regulatory subunit 1-like isoform X2 n=1 Tax=Ornithodoros turicata TaxID=34597 RepID=UPI003138A2DB